MNSFLCRVNRIRTYGQQPLEVVTGFQDQPLKPTRALPDNIGHEKSPVKFYFSWAYRFTFKRIYTKSSYPFEIVYDKSSPLGFPPCGYCF